jgi:hypothetical protein
MVIPEGDSGASRILVLDDESSVMDSLGGLL